MSATSEARRESTVWGRLGEVEQSVGGVEWVGEGRCHLLPTMTIGTKSSCFKRRIWSRVRTTSSKLSLLNRLRALASRPLIISCLSEHSPVHPPASQVKLASASEAVHSTSSPQCSSLPQPTSVTRSLLRYVAPLLRSEVLTKTPTRTRRSRA